jgi:hypothetical protein
MAEFVRGPFASIHATVFDRLGRCAGCRVQCQGQCVCMRMEVELEAVKDFMIHPCHTVGDTHSLHVYARGHMQHPVQVFMLYHSIVFQA